MRRMFVSALLLSALCVPAWAEPLSNILNPANAPLSQDAASEAARAVAPAAAPLRLAAAQPDLGGGFIQFLFGGTADDASQSSAYRTEAGQGSLPSATAPSASAAAQAPQTAALVADPDQAAAVADDSGYPPVDPKYDRQTVAYDGKEPPGTIIVDTSDKFLYLVEDGGKALRYGIGVGRQGFTWSGVETVSAKREWPDWRPPAAMLKRQPELPRFMAGGPQNPLGARALYLGSTDYRIHGSNEPWTIGHNVSSGCIRLRNADIEDLYNRVKVGTKVVVM